MVVAFDTGLAFRSIKVLLSSEAWVQHTLRVIDQVELMMSSAKDAETGNRCFLITGDERYIEPYTSAVKRLPGEIDSFASLTADNRSQQVRALDGPTAFGDPKLVRVVLEDLFGNAGRFSSQVAEPVVEFGWDREAAAWFVKDNGVGFEMFYADKLFNAFNRVHGDKDFKGSGIGLATAARVVNRHHGKIWAESAVGRGATFRFTLG